MTASLSDAAAALPICGPNTPPISEQAATWQAEEGRLSLFSREPVPDPDELLADMSLPRFDADEDDVRLAEELQARLRLLRTFTMGSPGSFESKVALKLDTWAQELGLKKEVLARTIAECQAKAQSYTEFLEAKDLQRTYAKAPQQIVDDVLESIDRRRQGLELRAQRKSLHPGEAERIARELSRLERREAIAREYLDYQGWGSVYQYNDTGRQRVKPCGLCARDNPEHFLERYCVICRSEYVMRFKRSTTGHLDAQGRGNDE